MVLEHLANMAIDLFATASVIARTQWLIETAEERVVTDAVALCDLFCVTAGRRFRSNRLALENGSDDEQRRIVAGQVRAGRGYSVPDAVLPETGERRP
jgi:hypothetical protein